MKGHRSLCFTEILFGSLNWAGVKFHASVFWIVALYVCISWQSKSNSRMANNILLVISYRF
jgi:hypothetical protein